MKQNILIMSHYDPKSKLNLVPQIPFWVNLVPNFRKSFLLNETLYKEVFNRTEKTFLNQFKGMETLLFMTSLISSKSTITLLHLYFYD